MVAAGILANRQVELLAGEIIEMTKFGAVFILGSNSKRDRSKS